MRTRVSVALNGEELHSIDPAIILHGAQEDAPRWNIATAPHGDHSGMFVTGFEKQYREITVKFAICERRDLDRRMQILMAVNQWAANGGNLSLSYRPGQILRVVCRQLPAIGNITAWTDDYQIVFAAYSIPFWESTARTAATVAAGTSGNAILKLTSTAESKLCVEAVNASGGTLTGLTVTGNGGHIELSGANIASGETVRIFYDQNDIQVIRAESGGTARSLLAYRTPESADYIPLGYGQNVIFVSSAAAASWTLYTYGRWE